MNKYLEFSNERLLRMLILVIILLFVVTPFKTKGIENNYNFVEINNSSFRLQNSQTINMQDILQNLQVDYMTALLLCSTYLFIYVLFNNFVRIKKESKYFWLVDAMHEWAIIPVVFLLIIAITYFSKFKGV